MRTILDKANAYFDSITEEVQSMPKSAQRDMWLEQQHDPEWQVIENNILPRTRYAYGANDTDMMEWAIFIQRLQLVWIRRWKRKHIKEIIYCSEMEHNAKRRG